MTRSAEPDPPTATPSGAAAAVWAPGRLPGHVAVTGRSAASGGRPRGTRGGRMVTSWKLRSQCMRPGMPAPAGRLRLGAGTATVAGGRSRSRQRSRPGSVPGVTKAATAGGRPPMTWRTATRRTPPASGGESASAGDVPLSAPPGRRSARAAWPAVLGMRTVMGLGPATRTGAVGRPVLAATRRARAHSVTAPPLRGCSARSGRGGSMCLSWATRWCTSPRAMRATWTRAATLGLSARGPSSRASVGWSRAW